MKNIIDYVAKYGDLSFEEKPLNKVDALIFSQFAYFKLGSFVPFDGSYDNSISIEEMAGRDNVSELFSDERYAANNSQLFHAMASSKRFASVRLSNFIDLVSNKWEMQFSAVTFYLSPGATHVVFRGTDESIVGWKEDFNMTFMTPIPAQVKAVDYLHYAAERIRGDFSVGGHSKGGNLAVYSVMKCSKYVRDRVTVIYSHDGPGFTKETLADADFDAIADRILKFVPRSSIVGMLLQSHEKYRVVEAGSVGILQHDPFNWVVGDDDFVYRDDVAGRYVISDEAVNEWASRAGADEMKVFVDKVYSVFVEAGVSDVNDLKSNAGTIMAKARSVMGSLDEEDRRRIKAVLSVFIESVKDQVKDQINIFATK